MAVTAAIVNMVIGDNSTWRDAFQFGTPGDTTWAFTGCTFKCEVKAQRTDVTPLLTAQSTDGTIVIDDPVQRVLHFNVPMATIKADIPAATYIYDLIMTDGSGVRTQLMQGYIRVRKGVTED